MQQSAYLGYSVPPKKQSEYDLHLFIRRKDALAHNVLRDICVDRTWTELAREIGQAGFFLGWGLCPSVL
jgi:hypothetical protein